MITQIQRKYTTFIHRVFSAFLALTFIFSSIVPPQRVQAQSVLNLPQPGSMVNMSPVYTPPHLIGMKIDPETPFRFNFILDSGHVDLQGEELKEESNKLVRYFLAALTVPEEDLWVNLSPYESDRIIPTDFGKTEMGRDLLAQDYILKQLTASLMYPEEDLGKKFWDRVYKRANELYGTAEIPVNTFNKVWIVPDTAVIHKNGNTIIVVDTHLRVLLEKDYLATSQNLNNTEAGKDQPAEENVEELSEVSSEIVRNILLPEIEKEVNEGKHFAPLRQIYHSMVLAIWYKKKLKNSPLNIVYANQKKVEGINIEDNGINQKIYDQYIEAFRKGVYDYIKEDYDSAAQGVVPRKYFSGGLDLTAQQFAQGNPSSRRKEGAIFELDTGFDFNTDGGSGASTETAVSKPPKGAASTLLRYMSDNRIFRDNQRRSKELAGQRGGNDSQRNIQRELRVLQDVGLVLGNRNGYYLADWLQGESVETIIADNDELNFPDPNPAQSAAVHERVKTVAYRAYINNKTGPPKQLRYATRQKWIERMGIITEGTPPTFKELGRIVSERAAEDGIFPSFYSHEIIRRLGRTAIMHFNLSHDPQHLGDGYAFLKWEKLSLSKDDIPGAGEEGLRLYSVSGAGETKLAFLGKVDSDGFISSFQALFMEDEGGKYSVVSDFEAFLNFLGIAETEKSRYFLSQYISGYESHQHFLKDQQRSNLNKWLEAHDLDPSTSWVDLIRTANETLPAHILNGLLERLTTDRHAAVYAYSIPMEEKHRAITLEPLSLREVRVPKSGTVTHISLNEGTERVLEADDAFRLYLHPYTVSQLEKNLLMPEGDVRAEGADYHPSVGNRSGYVMIDGQPYLVKLDLPVFQAGNFKIAGIPQLINELGAAAFFTEQMQTRHPLPEDLNLFLATEGVIVELEDDLEVVTIVRPVPLRIKDKILVPGALLYSQPSLSEENFLAELTRGMTSEEIDDFFRNILIRPLMRAFNYHLSLENSEENIFGITPQMHGANVHYVWDPIQSRFTGEIAVKDYSAKMILRSDNSQEESNAVALAVSKEYDYTMGRLYFFHLIAAMQEITGKSTAHFDEIVRDVFQSEILPENKEKFLVNGELVGVQHADPFALFQKDKKDYLWSHEPRFRTGPSSRQPGGSSSPLLVSEVEDAKVGGTDNAMLSNPGGIDMHSKWLNLQEDGEGELIIFDINPQQFKDFKIQGITPAIFNITPLPSLSPLLGSDSQKYEEQLSRIP